MEGSRSPVLNAKVVAAEEDPHSHAEGGVGIIFVDGVSRTGDGAPRLAVLTLIADSPAQIDGTIQPGDLIAAVNGVSVIGKSLEEVRRLILGPINSKVQLSFHRPVNGETRSFSVTLTRHHADHGHDRLNREREERQRVEMEYKRQIAHLRNQIEQLQHELHGERNNVSRLDQEWNSRARREISTARSELEEVIQRLRVDLQAARDDALRYKNGVAEIEARLRAAESDVRTEAERRAAVEAELAQLRRQLENDRTQLGMRGEYEKVLVVMRSKLQTSTDDLRAETLRRERAEEDAARLQDQLRQSQEQLATREQQSRSLIAEHTSNQDRLLRENHDLREQLRSHSAQLQRERDNVIRLQAENKSREDEIRALQDALGEHRRAVASLEAQLNSTREENHAFSNRLQDESMHLRKANLENGRLNAENSRLGQTVKDLSLRLDSADASLQQRENEILALRRDISALSAELANSRARVSQLNDELRNLEGVRNEDRRTLAHEMEKLEARLRSEADDNRALAYTNTLLSNELAGLRSFADAAQARDRLDAMNVDRHLLRLHTAADQMNSTLSEVIEAKRSLASNRIALPPTFGAAGLPPQPLVHTSVAPPLMIEAPPIRLPLGAAVSSYPLLRAP